MPDAYEVFEGRFVAVTTATSAANALVIATSAVPANRVWTIVAANYVPSVAETRQVCWDIITANGTILPITTPQSFAYGGSAYLGYPLTREGMELKLYPGQYLNAARDAATAGSTISIYVLYIESALPLFEEYEPQVRRAQIKRRGSAGQRSTGGVYGGGGEPGVVLPPSGGGEGGGGEPVL